MISVPYTVVWYNAVDPTELQEWLNRRYANGLELVAVVSGSSLVSGNFYIFRDLRQVKHA